MNSNGKISIWSVVVLIVSVIVMAVSFSLGLISANAAKELEINKIDIKSNMARIQVLERQNDVILNELKHINDNLNELIDRKK